MRVRVLIEMDDGGVGIRAVNVLDAAMRAYNEKLRHAVPDAAIDFEVLGVVPDAEVRAFVQGEAKLSGNPHADHEFCDPTLGCVVAEEPDWEYGWHTGSTVSLIGRRDQVEEWLAVRGWKLGEGDWGSRVMRRRVAGAWSPAEA